MARKSNFSEAQMIEALQEIEAGASQADVARKLGVTAQTILRWRSKYGGMTVNEAQEKKRLEDENRKLRQLVAQQALDIAVLKEVVGKKW
ncbi:MAG: transposase [Gaiellaceae bacterium]